MLLENGTKLIDTPTTALQEEEKASLRKLVSAKFLAVVTFDSIADEFTPNKSEILAFNSLKKPVPNTATPVKIFLYCVIE